MNNKYIRSDLENYKPYEPHNILNTHKLDANESPFNLTDGVRKKLIKWLRNDENLNIYPDTNNTKLRKSLSNYYGISIENITCGVGSDQLIDYITKVFLEIDDNILISSPTFAMYELTAHINRAKVIDVALNSDFTLNSKEIIKKCNENDVKIIFLCTPNNPTGNIIPTKQICEILENVSSIVVVDEAYAEFSNTSMIDRIGDYNNLIVLRTFSKAYGLAGARIGYAIACEELILAINIVRAPYNLPTISQFLAVEALNDNEVYQKRILYLISEKKYLFEKLKNINKFNVVESEANFVYIENNDLKMNLHEKLINKGILVRKFNDESIEKLRITVGTRKQNDLILEVLNEEK